MIRIIAILFPVLIIFSSCSDDATELVFDPVSLATSQDLSALSIYDNQVIAIGGDAFEQGIMLTGKDNDWQEIDSLSDKRLFGIDCDNIECISVGQDGYFYRFDDVDGWRFVRLAYWGFQRAVSRTDDHIVSVIGKSFEQGSIYHIDRSYAIDTIIETASQIQDIAAVDNSTFVAVGYGSILRSTDGGYNWLPIAQEGDFYHSIDFIDIRNGIIVGQSGTILLTDDGGQTWTTIKNPASISSNRDHFLSVRYINESTIYIVGDNGLLWKSNDAGQSWQDYKVNTNHNLNDVIVHEGMVYIVGDGGYLGKAQR